MQTGAATVENSMEFPQKTKNGIAFWPGNSIARIKPKNPETPIQKNLCTPMFIAAQFTIAKYWKQPRCPSINEWIKKLWYIYTMEFYAAERKKELLPFALVWMELESIMLSEISQAVKTNTIWSHLYQEPNDKTNKQAKYNQRHWNWEQADSDQRGEGREFQGKRVKGL